MRTGPPRPSRLLWGIAVAVLLVVHPATPRVQAPAAFAARIAQLSERGGYFDTDNLISNEKSYLQVMPALRASRLSGGAYIGVGPDQNFSYIGQLHPDIAFIVDIRRDNLLLHLLFKALFALSDTRAGYASLLFGRPPPPDLESWKTADAKAIAAYLDRTPADTAGISALRARVDRTIKGFGVPLSDADWTTIDRFHRTFIDSGVGLQFRSTGRAPRPYYPTYRDLMLETDRQGMQSSFLASEASFQVVRDLERRDRIIPVVGNLAGPSALRAIGSLLESEHEPLTAFYTSNVEFYLFNDGSFPRFVDNLSHLPHRNDSLIIRSVFGGWAAAAPGYASVSLVQRVDDLLDGYAKGRFHTYGDIAFVR